MPVKELKVVIFGGRGFDDYALMRSKCDFFIGSKYGKIIIVVGKAKGADALAEKYAKEKGYEIREFYAEWDLYGLSAGPIRNGLMADYADAGIGFWDGKSSGTKNMIEQMKKRNKPLRIVRY